RGENRLPVVLRLIGNWICKTRRHDPDNSRLAAELYLTTDDALVTAKTSLPQTVAQKNHRRRSGFIFIARENAAELGLHTEHREVIRTHGDADHAFGITALSNDCAGALSRGNVLKGRRGFLHIDEVRD